MQPVDDPRFLLLAQHSLYIDHSAHGAAVPGPEGRGWLNTRMHGTVEYAPLALEMLRAIGDNSVVAELVDIAAKELCVVTRENAIDGFQGTVAGQRGMMWRRGIPRRDLERFNSFEVDDEDEFQRQACDYVLVYRRKASDEKIRFRHTHDSLVVVSVYHNIEMAPYLTRGES